MVPKLFFVSVRMYGPPYTSAHRYGSKYSSKLFKAASLPALIVLAMAVMRVRTCVRPLSRKSPPQCSLVGVRKQSIICDLIKKGHPAAPWPREYGPKGYPGRNPQPLLYTRLFLNKGYHQRTGGSTVFQSQISGRLRYTRCRAAARQTRKRRQHRSRHLAGMLHFVR